VTWRNRVSRPSHAVNEPRRLARLHGRAATLVLALLVSAALVVPLVPRAQAVDELQPPEIYAENAVVLSDLNQVLYDKNARQRTAMASTTKMMTAIVAVRHGNLDMEVEINEADLVGESSMGLWAGEVVTLRGLLYGLLMPSGNDAAMAIARSLGWQQGDTSAEESVQHFIDMMNAQAAEYQLRDTHYMNPHGLDEYGHYSTPFDLAIILRAALNYPIIRDIMQTRAINIDGHELWNGNRLYNIREDVLGGKTGFTDAALFCLAGAAKQDGRFVIAVVTRDDGDNWFYDVSNLIDFGLQKQRDLGVPTYISPTLVGTQLNQAPGTLQGSP
jgi:serine-type D-Ala-D-Ala carboxypeptidase (penicillin-binding protein 5/6)